MHSLDKGVRYWFRNYIEKDLIFIEFLASSLVPRFQQAVIVSYRYLPVLI